MSESDPGLVESFESFLARQLEHHTQAGHLLPDMTSTPTAAPTSDLTAALERAGAPAENIEDVRRLPVPGEVQSLPAPPSSADQVTAWLTDALRGVVMCGGARLIYLVGNLGRGKSSAAAYWLAHIHGARGCWVQSEEVAPLPADAQWATARLTELGACHALVLDDLGVRDRGSDGRLALPVQRLLAARCRSQRPTLITSNLPPREVLAARQAAGRDDGSLEAYLGDARLADRLRTRARLIRARGPNLRELAMHVHTRT